jgi:hypothetical protein
MEISEIKAKALKGYLNSTLHEELNNLLQEIGTKNIEEILNVQKDDDFRENDNKIRQLCIFHHHFSDDEKVELIAQLLFTENQYLVKAITNADVKSVSIFLRVNCYLEIDVEALLSNIHITSLLAEKIVILLLNINIETKVLPNAPYHEKKMTEESILGFDDNNINKAYELIESIERGGRGFHFNYLLENLISFLYSYDYHSFVELLTKFNHFHNFVFYFQSFPKEKLIKLASEPTLINKWLNFELIRQIIKKVGKNNFEKEDCFAVKSTITKIKTEDFDYLKQTINYFHTSSLFNAALGELMSSLSEDQIKEIVSDCFEINNYNSHIEARNLLLESFEVNATKVKFSFLLRVVFEKWNTYFKNLYKSDDFYLNNILLTDYADFIVNYFTISISSQDILFEMKKSINKIIYIDTVWSVSESKQITHFHIFYSYLYLLSYAYKYKKLNDSEILDLFSLLQQNKIQQKRYFKHSEQNIINIIDENLKIKTNFIE